MQSKEQIDSGTLAEVQIPASCLRRESTSVASVDEHDLDD